MLVTHLLRWRDEPNEDLRLRRVRLNVPVLLKPENYPEIMDTITSNKRIVAPNTLVNRAFVTFIFLENSEIEQPIPEKKCLKKGNWSV